MQTRRRIEKVKYEPNLKPQEIKHERTENQRLKMYSCDLCSRSINHKECYFCWINNKKETRIEFVTRRQCQETHIGLQPQEETVNDSE